MAHEIQLRSSPELTTLNLKELHVALQQRGISMSYSALSDLIRAGDIAKQLQVGGGGNRRQFLPDTVEVLAGFIPHFQALENLKDGAAPEALRQFLTREPGTPQRYAPVTQFGQTPDPTALALVPVAERAADWLSSLPRVADSLCVFEEIVRRIAAAQESRAAECREVFDADGAARYLCCSVRSLRRNVPASFRLGKSSEGDRWYRRDLLSLKGGER